jgi:uncharacterized protein YbbC (DUF1343 family)
MKKIVLLSIIFLSYFSHSLVAQQGKYIFDPKAKNREQILTGADQTAAYLPQLKNKRVGLIVNQTSEIEGVLLPDTLLKAGVTIVKIFSPEHGFRGNADAGAKVKSGVDEQTGLPVISLYGNNKKPTAAQLKDIDILVFDLQDVGARFYTYISTLQYALEACAENGKPLMVLDRPNPLGYIVDGPILESSNQSFVGMQPIPVVHGMTVGEYAKMLIGEKWLKSAKPVLTIIPCKNYTHRNLYQLPVSPSPNLKSMTAIYLYPSMCFFEGTQVSLGRGTDKPFQQFGHPLLKKFKYTFTPTSMPGATDPPLKNQKCYGMLVATNETDAIDLTDRKLQIKWLLEAYQNFPEKNKFFTSYFEKLAGTATLRKQIEQGLSEAAIRKSWEPGLNKFKAIRKKYLLYPEFE